jgi:hypothetical protein
MIANDFMCDFVESCNLPSKFYTIAPDINFDLLIFERKRLMRKLTKNWIPIKFLLLLILFFSIGTTQLIAMGPDPLQQQLGDLKNSMTLLKTKLETLSLKLMALKDRLNTFAIDENTKFVEFVKDLEDDSVSFYLCEGMGSTYSPNYILFTNITKFGGNVDNGPLGRYEKLEIKISKESIESKYSELNKTTPLQYWDAGQVWNICVGKFNDEYFSCGKPDTKLKEVSVTGDFYNRLEFLCLNALAKINLKKCSVLERLIIRDCPNLKEINIVDCPNLKNLDLAGSPTLERLTLKRTGLTEDTITNKPKGLKIEWQ